MIKKISTGTLLHKAAIAAAIILLPVFVTFLVSYDKNRARLEEDTLSDLTDQASVFEGFVYQFLDRVKQRSEDFSSDGVTRDSIGRITGGNAAEASRLNGYLARYKLPLDRSVHSIAIVSNDGRVLSSTDGGLMGKDFSGEEFFAGGRKKPTVAESGAYGAGANYIAAAAPIFSRVDGKTAGVIVNFIPVEELNLLLDRLRSGAHEKEHGVIPWNNPKQRLGLSVFIVNRHKRLISKPAASREAVINQAVDIASVRECLSGGQESSGFYDSFLKYRVAGASMCMPSLKWTLVLEVREDDVLRPVADLRRDAMITGAVVAGLLMFLFALFYKVVARPIKDLAKAAEAMARGDYRVAVYAPSRDEIGSLAAAFNRMVVEIENRTALLKESSDRLSAVVENSTAAIYMKDVNGRYILVNRTFESLLKLKRGNILGKTDFEVFPERFAGRFAENDRKVLETKEPHRFDEDAAQEDGIHHYVSIKVPIFGEGNEPVAVCGISTDITERKHYEERIEKLNRLYFVLSRISETIVRIKDAAVLYASACRILVEDGHFLMAWVGTVDADGGMVSPAASCCRIAEDYLANVRISVRDEPEGMGPTGTAIREGRTVIVGDIAADPMMAPWRDGAIRAGCRSCATFPLFMGAVAMGAVHVYSDEPFFFKEEEVRLLDSVAADLSFAINSIEFEKDAVRAEEELRFMQSLSLAVREAEDFHGALMVSIMKICEMTRWSLGEAWLPSQDGFRLHWHDAWCANPEMMQGFKDASKATTFLAGQGLPGRVWRTKQSEWVEDVSVNGAILYRAAIALETGFKSCVGIPILAGKGVIAVLVFFMTDERAEDVHVMGLVAAASAQAGAVLQKKLVEEARLELQRRFEELLNNITIGVFRTTLGGNGRFIEANPALVKMLGASSREDLLKHTGLEFYYDKGKRSELMGKIERHGFFRDELLEVVTLKNARLWVVASAVMHRDEDGNVFLDGVVEDVTQRKRMEEHLARSQKMDAVGQLAAGVAHDFNNILTAVTGYANLLNMKTGMDEQARGFANQILVLSERMADLTGSLLSFSREKEIKTEPIDLNALIRRFLKMIQRMLGDGVELKTTLSDADLTVMADASQMEQAFLAIASNARDAMPEGGTFSISTGAVELYDDFVKAYGYGESGKFAFAAMTDTGAGMDEATTARIFEPFFTTKEEGRGTGLGLAVVYGIIKQHNGFIETYSRVGEGTTFMIYIPLKRPS